VTTDSACLPRYIRSPDVVLREEPDGALLFNPDTNQIRVINTTGLFIWNACEGGSSAEDIVSLLQTSFDGVPAGQVAGQVRDFIDDMAANGFIGLVQDEGKQAHHS
jgi:hypothetical protein